MRKRDGFTLISVIIAIVLLSVGVMALANSMYYIARVTRTETQRTQALELASQYIEDLRARDPWGISSEALANIDSTGAVNVNGAFTRQLTVTNEGIQLLRLVLVVKARAGTRPPSITLTTLMFKVAT